MTEIYKNKERFSIANRALRKALNSNPEDLEIKAIREGIELLINKHGRIGAIAQLAKFLAKERDKAIEDSDYADAQRLVHEVTSGGHTGAVEEVFRPQGTENFSEGRSPGMASGIIRVPGQSGDYQKPAKLSSEDFYDSHSGMRAPDIGSAGMGGQEQNLILSRLLCWMNIDHKIEVIQLAVRDMKLSGRRSIVWSDVMKNTRGSAKTSPRIEYLSYEMTLERSSLP